MFTSCQAVSFLVLLCPIKSFIYRSIWFIIFTASVIFGIFLVVNIFQNWFSNPIITTIDNSHYALNKIDFPAVTICPVSKVMPKKLVNEVCKQKYVNLLKLEWIVCQSESDRLCRYCNLSDSRRHTVVVDKRTPHSAVRNEWVGPPPPAPRHSPCEIWINYHG